MLGGQNGLIKRSRRQVREGAFHWFTGKLRDGYTPWMAKTFGGKANTPQTNGWLGGIPPVPKAIDRFRYAPLPVWRKHARSTPIAWRRQAGIGRNAAAADKAWREEPLHDFLVLHPEGIRYLVQFTWNYISPSLPRMLRGYRRLIAARTTPIAARRGVEDPARMTEMIRTEAQRIGLSEIGFAAYDPRYTFAESVEEVGLPSVIVCLLEQDFKATQTLPSGRAERAAFRTYTELVPRVAELANFIRKSGYAASAEDFVGTSMSIHYGVEAGLGQLGMNGQLLTPQAGSRCRIALITTDAPVEYGKPVDYGIEALCDACQVCVRRCPVGAITNSRKEHRGITKAKIKTERCLPTMAQTHGCAVCMKVCPVQRYGLESVQEHFERTGEVLGKGTDDLEGYPWPLDGRYYGTASKPRIDSTVVQPDGFEFDGSRVAPAGETKGAFEL